MGRARGRDPDRRIHVPKAAVRAHVLTAARGFGARLCARLWALVRRSIPRYLLAACLRFVAGCHVDRSRCGFGADRVRNLCRARRMPRFGRSSVADGTAEAAGIEARVIATGKARCPPGRNSGASCKYCVRAVSPPKGRWSFCRAAAGMPSCDQRRPASAAAVRAAPDSFSWSCRQHFGERADASTP